MAQKAGSEVPLAAGFDEIMKVNADHMDSLAKSYGSLVDTVGKVNGETLNFCVERWKEEIEMPAKIAQCHAPEEVAQAYSSFLSKMFNDYNEQTRRVMDLVNEVTSQGLALPQNGHGENGAKSAAKKIQ